ncbi:MAG: Sir2 family NAD-dependent protein deacetylase [Vicinamibacterales bacterium]
MKSLVDRLTSNARITVLTGAGVSAASADLIRPGVVWFGESLDPDVMPQAAAATDCDVFITIGTAAVVYPAAGFIEQAKRNGAFTVEINPEATPATRSVDLALQGAAETILPQVDKLIMTG